MSKASQQTLNDFVHDVRSYLRDFPELNRLISGEETSDRMIAWSVIDAMDDINNSPPLITTWTVETFPFRSLLLRGTVLTILESIGLMQTRNQLNFNDGGISVGVSDKAPLIMNWINVLRSTYEDKKTRWKIARNIAAALTGSGIASDYYFIGGYYSAEVD
jgi:hypothetical protein